MVGRTWISVVTAMVLVIAFCPVASAAGLKGKWQITISPADRASLSTVFAFKKGGVGKAGDRLSGGGVAYREGESGFSATWEFAGPIIQAAALPGPCTIILRGLQDSENRVHGDVTIVTGDADPTTDSGYVELHGMFVGERVS